MRALTPLAFVELAAALLGCSKNRALPPAPDAGSTALLPAPAPTTPSAEEGRALAKNACFSCHSEEMLAQQRLTPAQWTKVVTKMVGWGANLEPNDTAPLTTWLSATYGTDAGPYEVKAISANAAPLEIGPLPDGPFAGGNPTRGRDVYTDKCSGCHGADARGHIGVLLVDRPFLYRAAEFAETIRRGRGKMAPIVMPEADVADILAHLRGLR